MNCLNKIKDVEIKNIKQCIFKKYYRLMVSEVIPIMIKNTVEP